MLQTELKTACGKVKFITAGFISLLFLCFNSTATAQTTSYTIFSPSDAPSTTLANDGNGIEVGVKIRTSVSGVITGIRYYKGAGTTGTHTGNFWTSSGSLLSSVVFTGETSSGWQEMLFGAPVPVVADTTYVASCFSASGDYGFTGSYFGTPKVNGPIRALANGEDGANGVFDYNGSPTFPLSFFNLSNYFVDVVFVPDSVDTSSSGTANYIAKFISADKLGNSSIYESGTRIGIGTTNVADTAYKLFVEKGIRTRKVKVDIGSWPDYVFDKNYELPTLTEIEKYISANKHLPGVPDAAEVEKEGLELGGNQALLLKKIEELTLYLIEMNKKLQQLEKENERLRTKLFSPPAEKTPSRN